MLIVRSKETDMVYYYESSEGDDMRWSSGWYFDLDNEAHTFYGPYTTEHDALEAYTKAFSELP